MHNGLFFRIIVAVSLLFSLNIVLGCQPLNTLTGESQPSSGGTVSPASGVFNYGDIVQVTAIPSPGYKFDHWEGAASGQAPIVQVTMNGPEKVIAHFIKT